jgi:hypothetical protein
MLRFLIYDQRTLRRWQSPSRAAECQELLKRQIFARGEPGTILNDVSVLLEFVGPGGIATKSRGGSIPQERLPELNAKVAHPVELALERALLRDYPNLAGLYVLLRTMDLLRVEPGRLVQGPAPLELWRAFNPAEQYFALLEAFLFLARASTLGGELSRQEDEALGSAASFLASLNETRWEAIDDYDAAYTFGVRGEFPSWSVFLLQQFGLAEVRARPPSTKQVKKAPGRGWVLGAARRTSWGGAVTWGLVEFLQREAGEQATRLRGEKPGVEDPDDWADTGAGEAEGERGFGRLQPVFQPSVPDWRAVFSLAPAERRQGTHVFKVTLGGWRGGGGGIWRRLAAPAEDTLDDLAGAILAAFGLANDHAYDFQFRDQRGRHRTYHHPWSDATPSTVDAVLGELGLARGSEMTFTCDYGDYWEFKVRSEKVEDGTVWPGQIKVIESAGNPPPQYPSSE